MRNRKLIQWLLPGCLLLNAGSLLAQKENLDDLVPYRKGKLWGLVHHDMKEFYKPVFDTIIMDIDNNTGKLGVFKKNMGKLVAEVVYKNERMWLWPDKQLTAAWENRATPETDMELSISSVNQEGVIDATDPAASPAAAPVIRDSFYTRNDRQQKVLVKHPASGGFQLFVNDEYLPAFDCDYYMKSLSNADGVVDYVILARSGMYGLGSLAQKKIILPVEYNSMRAINEKKWLIAARNNKTGIVTAENKIIVPFEYDHLIEADGTAIGDPLLVIATKERKAFFMKVREGELQPSATTYTSLFRMHIPGAFLARNQDKMGIVGVNDKVIVPLVYDDINSWGERFFMVRKGNQEGFIDAGNKFFLKEPVYSALYSLAEWFTKDNTRHYLFLASRDNTTFYVDNFGKEFIAK